MKKTIITTIAAIALAAPAVAGGLGIGSSGKNGNATTYSSASMSTNIGGGYGVKGSSMAQVGNQSTSNLTIKDHKIDAATSSVSFQGVEVKGGMNLPAATGYSSGSAKAFTEAWESSKGFGW